MVAILPVLAITRPAANPNAIWEAMNHPQSIRSFKVGLMRPERGCHNPDHKSGLIKPLRHVAPRGNIGRLTAYSIPTVTRLLRV